MEMTQVTWRVVRCGSAGHFLQVEAGWSVSELQMILPCDVNSSSLPCQVERSGALHVLHSRSKIHVLVMTSARRCEEHRVRFHRDSQSTVGHRAR